LIARRRPSDAPVVAFGPNSLERLSLEFNSRWNGSAVTILSVGDNANSKTKPTYDEDANGRVVSGKKVGHFRQSKIELSLFDTRPLDHTQTPF
jgi:hypothetical protein